MATAELILERSQDSAQAWALPTHIPELDGIRGLAMLMVLTCHSAMWLPIGWMRSVLIEARIGVDLLFVLSGFLITGILLDTRHDRRALRNFYVRRALRVWPLYFVFLALAFIVTRPIMPTMVPHGLSAAAYFFFVQNFFYVAGTGPMLDPTWSLAVEEQFYVVWPWAALRLRREMVLKVCCVVVAISPVIRIAMRMAGTSEDFVYANTLCRMDGIAMGGAIAAWVRAEGFDVEWLRRFAQLGLILGAFGTAVSFGLSVAPFATELRLSFITMMFGGLMAWVLVNQGTTPFATRLLRSFGLTRLGRISFGLYLFNLPLYTVMHGHWANRVFFSLPSAIAELSRFLTGNLLLLAIAAVSWRFYESRILGLKGRLAPRDICRESSLGSQSA